MLWCYQDYKSQRNLWPGEVEGYVDHGLVDELRKRRPSYAVWKELNSPARLTVRWTGPAERPPEGFSIEVVPNTERDLPFYPLHDYDLVWRVIDERGRILASGARSLPDLTAMVSASGAVAADAASKRYILSVQLLSPAGLRASESTLEWARDEAIQR
jgi:hypothetical protein